MTGTKADVGSGSRGKMAAYGVLELADLQMVCQKPATRTPEVEFSDKFETTGRGAGKLMASNVQEVYH
jgi:hypothetical protein